MKKGTWAAVTGIAVLLGVVGRSLLALAVAAVIIGVYLIICRLAPRTRHTGFRGCGGTGEARSNLFPWSYHRCEGCNGTGRQIRVGARFVGQPHVQAEHRNATRTRQSRRSGHSTR